MNDLRIVVLSAAMLAATTVFGQGASPSAPSPTAPSPPASGSTGMDRGAGTGASAKPGSAVAKADATFVKDAGADNKAEVALGTLAQRNAASAAVKDFGQKMVADHSKAYDELSSVAKGKGISVPTEPTAAQKRTADRLAKLSGAAFDREFAAVMVDEHNKAVALFRKEAKGGSDADLKAFAAKTLPTLEEHLTMAKHLQASVKGGK